MKNFTLALQTINKPSNLPRSIFWIILFVALVSVKGFAAIPLNTSSDNFLGAIEISTISGGMPITVMGNNIGATSESGEPIHTDDTDPLAPGNKSVWWAWTPNFSGTVTLSTEGSGTASGDGDPFVNTQVGVYTGGSIDATVTNLTTIVKKEDSDGVLANGWTRVTFNVIADAVYKIAVDGYKGATGNIKLTLSAGGENPTTNRYHLVVNVSPIGAGAVGVLPTQPGEGYVDGTLVTLTASGTNFSAWTGSVNSTSPTINVTMDAAKTVTAHFDSPPPSTNVNVEILFGSVSGQVGLWSLDQTNLVSSTLLQSSGAGWRIFGTSDLDGDGDKDFLYQATDGRVAYWLMNGNTLVTASLINNAGAAWRAVGLSDFNTNSTADILFQHTDGRLAVWYLNGTNYSSSAVLSLPAVGAAWKVVGVKDFNGDNKGDILFQHTNGQIGIWYMNGAAFSSSAVVANAGTSWKIVGLGDFNNDSRTDFLWQNTQRQLAVWFLNGTNGVTYTGNAFLNHQTPLASGWNVRTVK